MMPPIRRWRTEKVWPLNSNSNRTGLIPGPFAPRDFFITDVSVDRLSHGGSASAYGSDGQRLWDVKTIDADETVLIRGVCCTSCDRDLRERLSKSRGRS